MAGLSIGCVSFSTRSLTFSLVARQITVTSARMARSFMPTSGPRCGVRCGLARRWNDPG